MRPARSITFGCLCLAILQPVDAAAALLCFEQQKTGFALGNWSHKWEVSKFANLKRFIIRPPTVTEADADPQRVWMVNEEGKDYAVAECLQDFAANGVLECHGDLKVMVNKQTARFQVFQQAGYVAGRQGETSVDGQLTPYLSIGACKATP